MAKYLDAMARAQKQRETRQSSPAETQASAPIEEIEAAAGSAQDGAELARELARVERNAPLGAIPKDEAKPAKPAAQAGAMPFYHPSVDETVIGAHDPMSPITEQVRHIRTNLETVLKDHESRPIVITSPISGDGKTLFTANLATVLADDPDHHVLLIDADMRKPDQHRLFQIPAKPGLAEYLDGRAELDEVIQSTSLPNLSVIGAGYPPANPTALLKNDRAARMVQMLQRKFQWILFDTPPLLPVTDASVIGRESVGVILVVRMGQTHRNTIRRAQEVLAETRLPVLGCVLNDFVSESRENEYYYTYYGKKDGKGGFAS